MENAQMSLNNKYYSKIYQNKTKRIKNQAQKSTKLINNTFLKKIKKNKSIKIFEIKKIKEKLLHNSNSYFFH